MQFQRANFSPNVQAAFQSQYSQPSLQYSRNSQVGTFNPPTGIPVNYHTLRQQQQQQQLQQQQQQPQLMKQTFSQQVRDVELNQNNYRQNEFGFNSNKSRVSMQAIDPYQQNQGLTPKQIGLLDKIENIKRKGASNYVDEKGQKFPPLSQIPFPNLQAYAEEKPSSQGGKQQQQSGLNNPGFNQKSMINTFNGNYREQQARSPYSQNPFVKQQAFDGFNRGAKLPRLDQGGVDRNAAQSPNDANVYTAVETTGGDKRKKYTSYDINIHNSQLLNRMMDNNSNINTSNNNTINNNSNFNPNQSGLYNNSLNNSLKPYQNPLSPLKKFTNNNNTNNVNTIPGVRQTPEKVMGQSNSFSQYQNSGNKEEQSNNNINPSNGNTQFKVAMKTKAGCNVQKVTKTNQDSAIVCPKVLADIGINQFSVADGHGLNGHLVSQLIKRSLPKNVGKFLKPDDYSADSFRNAITRGFYATNQEIFTADFDCNLSGSTLISVFIHENKLYCGNVGDSRAIIGKQKSNQSGFRAHPLSVDQKPSLERERVRILKAGGRVDCQRDYTGQPLGPLRVWLSSMDMPGLAMTRSMGDKVGVQAGVIAEPEIEEMQLSEEDKFMVVASDGVWEYLSDQEVIKIVAPFYDRGLPEQAAEKLINESTNAWRRESMVRDDITAIVVFFNHGYQRQGLQRPY